MGHIIMQNVSSHHVPQGKGKKVRNIGIPLVIAYPSGFFDGTAANYTRGAGFYY